MKRQSTSRNSHRIVSLMAVSVLVVVVGSCGAESSRVFDDEGWVDDGGGSQQQLDEAGHELMGDSGGGVRSRDVEEEDYRGLDSGDDEHDEDLDRELDGGGWSDDSSTSADASADELLRRRGDATPRSRHDGANR